MAADGGVVGDEIQQEFLKGWLALAANSFIEERRGQTERARIESSKQ